VHYFASRLNNDFVEAMNAQIPAVKAHSMGYAATGHLIAIAYLLCAKFAHLPANPWTTPNATQPHFH
jgi:hypothetical protein